MPSPAIGGKDRRPRKPIYSRKHIYQGDPLSEPPPPEVVEIIRRHIGKRDALITVLQELQVCYGYLPERPLRHVARGLQDTTLDPVAKIPEFKVSAVRIARPSRARTTARPDREA